MLDWTVSEETVTRRERHATGHAPEGFYLSVTENQYGTETGRVYVAGHLGEYDISLSWGRKGMTLREGQDKALEMVTALKGTGATGKREPTPLPTPENEPSADYPKTIEEAVEGAPF